MYIAAGFFWAWFLVKALTDRQMYQRKYAIFVAVLFLIGSIASISKFPYAANVGFVFLAIGFAALLHRLYLFNKWLSSQK
jgi:hypothetical protein